MITKENLKPVLDSLKSSDITEAIESGKDYFLIEVDSFNGGSIANISAMDYSPTAEEEALNRGMLFVDLDQLTNLVVDSGSTNPLLLDLI